MKDWLPITCGSPTVSTFEWQVDNVGYSQGPTPPVQLAMDVLPDLHLDALIPSLDL